MHGDGGTADEAAFLYTLVERSCEERLLVEAAATGGREKRIIKEVEAECIFDDKCSGMCLCSYDGLFLPPSRFRGWLRVI